MDLENFSKLKQIIEKDVKLTDDNITEKSLNYPLMYQKYLDIFINEFKIYKELTTNKNKKYGKLYDFYKFDFDKHLDSKNEIESYINSNDEYYQMLLKCNEQESIVKYLENTLENISKLTFTIKNYIEYKNFLSGK